MNSYWNYLEQVIKDCKECKLAGNGYAVERIHDGIDRLIMFVGEAPGEHEEQTKLPFVGRSGKLLDSWISQLGIKNYVITNIVKHRPPNNATPTDYQIYQCKPILKREIEYYEPDAVILLGRTAVNLYSSEKLKLETWIQKSLNNELSLHYDKDIPVYILYHPSYVLRDLHSIDEPLKKLKLIIEDLNKN